MAEAPKSIVWSITLFPERSLGQAVFPLELEGRKRSTAILTRPARMYVHGIRRWSLLEKANIATAENLLMTEETDLVPWLIKPQERYLDITKSALSDGLNAIVAGPEDHLMQAIFGGLPKNFLIPPESEPARQERIQELLKSLPPEENLLIQLRFGLDSLPPKSVAVIAKEQKTTPLHAHHTIDEGIKKLHFYSRSKRLREFLPNRLVLA